MSPMVPYLLQEAAKFRVFLHDLGEELEHHPLRLIVLPPHSAPSPNARPAQTSTKDDMGERREMLDETTTPRTNERTNVSSKENAPPPPPPPPNGQQRRT